MCVGDAVLVRGVHTVYAIYIVPMEDIALVMYIYIYIYEQYVMSVYVCTVYHEYICMIKIE